MSGHPGIITDKSAFNISFAFFTLTNFSGNSIFYSGVPTNFDCNSLNGNLDITIWFGFIGDK